MNATALKKATTPNESSSVGQPRRTAQRTTVQSVVLDAKRPLTIMEIHIEAAHGSPGCGIATVYRALATLQDQGLVKRIQLPNDAPRYEPARLAEHHYFFCKVCQHVYWAFGNAPEVSPMRPAGFLEDRYEVYLYGTCRPCIATSQQSQDLAKKGRHD